MRLFNHLKNASTRLLLERVWGIEDTADDRHWRKRVIPYFNHYKDVLASSDMDNLRAEELAQLVEAIKCCDVETATTAEVINGIRAHNFTWIPPDCHDLTLFHLLDLAIKLWLFTTTTSRKHNGTLQECVGSAITKSFDKENQDDLTRLSDDFCAKNLERRGGFTIHWTSELAEHLTCVDKKVIRVFRHGSVIQSYLNNEDGCEITLLPDDLLTEIDSTFYLLFPYEGTKAAKYAQNESEKRKVDLVEAGWADEAVGEFSRLQLKSYPRFGNRLADIQRRYDAAKPRHPKQWWYDRRQRMEWAALMIALLVFVLTIITLATSILQVYAAFRNT